MTPSSGSISGPNFVLNTTVADTLSEIADILESSEDIDKSVQTIIKDIMKAHKRIIFDGNNYSDEWVDEAKKRGLSNIKNMVDSVITFLDEKNIDVLGKFNVLSEEEIHARYEIGLESYSKTINIEALTTLSMAKTEILPATINYVSSLASSIVTINSTGIKVDTSAQEKLLTEASVLNGNLSSAISLLETKVSLAQAAKESILEQAELYRDEVYTAMCSVRKYADELEVLCDSKLWPFPTYADLLFRV